MNAELYETIVKVVEDKVREIRVTREDFNALKNVVHELSVEVRELVKAQKGTQAYVEEIAQSLKRTQAYVEELAQAHKELAKEVRELAQALKRTDEHVEELAKAQKRTEDALTQLAKAVGRLSDNVGYGLEDVAKVVLPGYLQKHYNIIVEELERKFIEKNGDYVEVNLYGEGQKDGKKIILLGESKARIHQREVEKFVEDISKVEFKEEVLKFMFGYYVHPSAQKIASLHHILLVASYQK